MRISFKTPIAIALGAALVAGSIAPSFAFSGPGAALRGMSQGGTSVPKVEVRGGARYQKLHDDRAAAQRSQDRDMYGSRDTRMTAEAQAWGHYGTL